LQVHTESINNIAVTKTWISSRHPTKTLRS